MKRLALTLLSLLLLSGCAPVAREPDNLALVRVLGVDGSGPVTLTAVCGGIDGENVSRGTATAADFLTARQRLPWSGKGEELSLTGVSFLLVGPDVDLTAVLFAVLEDADLGATATVWVVETGAAEMLDACADPAADLELLALQGVQAPTVAQAVAALSTEGVVSLPCLGERDGRVEAQGVKKWTVDN